MKDCIGLNIINLTNTLPN